MKNKQDQTYNLWIIFDQIVFYKEILPKFIIYHFI